MADVLKKKCAEDIMQYEKDDVTADLTEEDEREYSISGLRHDVTTGLRCVVVLLHVIVTMIDR